MRTGRGRIATILGMAAVLVATLFSAPAMAQSTQTFRNLANNRCIDSFGQGGTVHAARVHDCNTGNNQRWFVDRFGEFRRLRNAGTNDCIDANGTAVAPAVMRGCNDGHFQQWTVDRPGDGSIKFRNRATNMCLDSNGDGNGPLVMQHCNPGPYQRWL